MKHFLLAALAVLLSSPLWADTVSNKPDPKIILDRVLTSRPSKNFSLKARLFVGRTDPVPVEILVQNGPSETRTIYRGGQTEALVVQPVHGAPQYYLRGTGELTGPQRAGRLLGSHFSYYDLGLPFLQWPNAKFIEEGRVRGRNCFTIESVAEGEPYTRVKMYIDKNYFALLRAEAFDVNGDLTRRLAVTSFKKIAEVWVPRGLEASYVPPGQSLPNEEKSRLEVLEGDYDAKLPPEWFDSGRFGPP